MGGSFLKFFSEASEDFLLASRVCEYACSLREFAYSSSNSCSSSRAGLPVSAVDSAVGVWESGRVVRAKWVCETNGSRPGERLSLEGSRLSDELLSLAFYCG